MMDFRKMKVSRNEMLDTIKPFLSRREYSRLRKFDDQDLKLVWVLKNQFFYNLMNNIMDLVGGYQSYSSTMCGHDMEKVEEGEYKCVKCGFVPKNVTLDFR